MTLAPAPDFQHNRESRIGVLLVNLGTPEAPTAKALRPYLRQFLSDRRVVEANRVLWWFILNAIVVPFRAPRSAKAYAAVWTQDGSPLLINCRAQAEALGAQLDGDYRVALGMSYGAPSIADALHQLQKQECRHLVVLPLYPQYASSTTGSVFCDVAKTLSTWRALPHLRFIREYCSDARYISALADSIRPHQKQERDMLIFSFHGTPLSMLTSGDPYHCLCHKTARLTAQALGLGDSEWMVTFQSRFGREPWLQPYTDKTLEGLPGRGVKKVQIVCPAFSADCLETLEEIAQENRDIFMEAGGESYEYIPALNAAPAHIDFLSALIRDATADWRAQLAKDNSEREAQHAHWDKMRTLDFYSPESGKETAS